jgi:lauroyl/myristoyl acyltransferase
MRTVASVLFGPVVSLLTLMLCVAPLWTLLKIYDWLPSAPLSRRTYDHHLAVIEANLCAAGYVDQPAAWRRGVARQVVAATIRTHFVLYLTLLLPRDKMLCLIERVTTPRGMEHLQEAFKAHAGAIVVGLHWELILAPTLYVGHALPLTVLAELRAFEYSLGSDREPPAPTFHAWVNSDAPTAAKTLAHRLRTGQIVMLFFDVPLRSGTRHALARRIHFLGQEVPRYDTAAWLSTHTGKPILFVSIHREGNQLVMDFSAPLLPNQDLAPSEQVADLTTRLYGTAEQIIRRNPAAWLVWRYWHRLVVPPMVVPDSRAPVAEGAEPCMHTPVHLELHHGESRV